jgi:hypothetical protein
MASAFNDEIKQANSLPKSPGNKGMGDRNGKIDKDTIVGKRVRRGERRRQ